MRGMKIFNVIISVMMTAAPVQSQSKLPGYPPTVAEGAQFP